MTGRHLRLIVGKLESKALAWAWRCSLAGAVERLALEADDHYQGILFPEMVLDGSNLRCPKSWQSAPQFL